MAEPSKNHDPHDRNKLDLIDEVCAICDNGGNLICCEGRCMRSFHATREDGEDTDCKSLGLTKAQVEAAQKFLCNNCKYHQHQCFACGKLGSSNKADAEVFRCVDLTCGHFYHPKCVAYLLFRKNKTEAAECAKRIAAGESFTCRVHKCHVCKQEENREVEELQFAVCRRCPKSYHRKCLPSEIEEGNVQRAWDGLLSNRILIYCLKHKVEEDLGTPLRNHIVFPEIIENIKILDMLKSNGKVLAKKRRPVIESDRSMTKQAVNLQKQKQSKHYSDNMKIRAHKSDGLLSSDHNKSPSENEAVAAPIISSAPTSKIARSSLSKSEAEMEKLIDSIEEETSSLTLKSIFKKLTVPSTHLYTVGNIDKSVTSGTSEAIKECVQILEDGGTMVEAKAVCQPDELNQLIKWDEKQYKYLAPFLNGMLYTSFGRQFTKVDKLQEIVAKLQWYVQNGDTIVDFCCGANDFSRLMKEKLDAAGKRCSFKNYDVVQPEYDFSFERKDWMKVEPQELPSGSRLIMGLIPPFGDKASLANKYIDKALTFNPKLLILMVPRETQRLDSKSPGYDLIWEDRQQLLGEDDMKINRWNFKPPSLYLWSRADWTTKYKVIASKQGHEFKVQQEPPIEERTQAQEQDVHPHPPKEQILERFVKETAIPQQSTRKEETNKKIAKESRKSEPAGNLDCWGSTKKRKEETNMKIAKESKKKEPLGNIVGWGSMKKRTKRRMTRVNSLSRGISKT